MPFLKSPDFELIYNCPQLACNLHSGALKAEQRSRVYICAYYNQS